MRRRHALLSVCLAAMLIALAVWLLSDEADGPVLPPHARIAPEGDTPAARTEGPGQAEHREPRAEAPHLVGREPATSEGALGGDVTVVVVGPSGKPVADVPVYASRSWQEKVNPASADRWIPGPPTHQRGNIQVPTVWETVEEQVFAGRTNEAGRVEMPDILLDGSTSVRLACGDVQGKPVTSTRCELRIDTLLPFTTEIVDASSGTRVEADWSFLGRGWQREDGEAATWVGGPGPWDPTIYVTAPHGWIAWDPTTTGTAVSRAAKSLVYRYPLRPEAKIVVEFQDETGESVEAPTVVEWRIGRHSRTRKVQQTHQDGRVLLHGVPFLPGALLHISATDGSGRIHVEGRLPDTCRETLILTACASTARDEGTRSAASAVQDAAIRIAGPSRDPARADVHVRIVDERRRGLPFVLVELVSPGRLHPPTWIDETKGIQRIDAFTDQVGERTWTNLEPGEWSLSTWWAGQAVLTHVRLEPGQLAEVEICPRSGE